MTKFNMREEFFSDEDWLDRMYRKSKSSGTRSCAATSLNVFDQFCQWQTGLNGKSREEIILKYQT